MRAGPRSGDHPPSGGVYTEGPPSRDRDIATQYLRFILDVIGIANLTFVAVGDVKAVDMGEVGMKAFVGRLEVAYRAVDLGVAEQGLHRAQVAGLFVDDRRLGPP